MGRSVCVLERGRELRPGDYPDTPWRALRQLQVRTPRGRLGPRSALFELHADDEVSVMVGCGLGGTSLINAGVALRPPAWVFDDERWPAELRGRGSDVLGPYFERAERMLGSTPYPDEWPDPAKLAALEVAADGVGGDGRTAQGQRHLRGRRQRRRRPPRGMHAVRRLRQRMQPQRQEHGARQLPARRRGPRRRDLLRDAGSHHPPRCPGAWAGSSPSTLPPTGGTGSVPRPPSCSPTWSCSPPARSGPPRSSCGPAARACPSPPGWGLGSAATATSWRSPTTPTSRCAGSVPAAAPRHPRPASVPASPAWSTSPPTGLGRCSWRRAPSPARSGR